MGAQKITEKDADKALGLLPLSNQNDYSILITLLPYQNTLQDSCFKIMSHLRLARILPIHARIWQESYLFFTLQESCKIMFQNQARILHFDQILARSWKDLGKILHKTWQDLGKILAKFLIRIDRCCLDVVAAEIDPSGAHGWNTFTFNMPHPPQNGRLFCAALKGTEGI